MIEALAMPFIKQIRTIHTLSMRFQMISAAPRAVPTFCKLGAALPSEKAPIMTQKKTCKTITESYRELGKNSAILQIIIAYLRLKTTIDMGMEKVLGAEQVIISR